MNKECRSMMHRNSQSQTANLEDGDYDRHEHSGYWRYRKMVLEKKKSDKKLWTDRKMVLEQIG